MLMMSGGAERPDEVASDEGDYLTGSARRECDFCSRDGAQRLKTKIEAYWAERGHKVQVMLLNVGFHPAIRASRFDVRSDMINGRPRTVARMTGVAPVLLHIEDVDNSDDDLVFE